MVGDELVIGDVDDKLGGWVGGWEERCLISSSLVWNLGIEKVAEYI